MEAVTDGYGSALVQGADSGLLLPMGHVIVPSHVLNTQRCSNFTIVVVVLGNLAAGHQIQADCLDLTVDRPKNRVVHRSVMPK